MRPNVLKGEMAKHGLTVKYMAGELGLSPVTMGLKVNGRADFTLTEIRKILAVFRETGKAYTVEELFGLAP